MTAPPTAPPPMPPPTPLDIEPPFNFVRAFSWYLRLPIAVVALVPMVTIALFVSGTRSSVVFFAIAFFWPIAILALVITVIAMRVKGVREDKACLRKVREDLESFNPNALPLLAHLRPDSPLTGMRARTRWESYDSILDTPPSFEEHELKPERNGLYIDPKTGKRKFPWYLWLSAFLIIAYYAYFIQRNGLRSIGHLVLFAIAIGVSLHFGRSPNLSPRTLGKQAPIVDPTGIELRTLRSATARFEWSRTRVVLVGTAQRTARFFLFDTHDGRTETVEIHKEALPMLVGAIHAAHTLDDQRNDQSDHQPETRAES